MSAYDPAVKNPPLHQPPLYDREPPRPPPLDLRPLVAAVLLLSGRADCTQEARYFGGPNNEILVHKLREDVELCMSLAAPAAKKDAP